MIPTFKCVHRTIFHRLIIGLLCLTFFACSTNASVEVYEENQFSFSYPEQATASKETVLPVINITTEEEINDQAIKAILDIHDIDGTLVFSGNSEIKLRGNSTRYRDKHPYKLKLHASTNLFEMGSSKHWVLLANDIDHTLVRNKITLDLARSIGMDSTPQSILVSLFLNNEYEGVYQLAQHIRIGESTVNIRSGSQYPATGGFLLEENFFSMDDESQANIPTSFQMPFCFNDPEQPSQALKEYASNYIQSFEYALHSPDFIYHSNAQHYEAVALGKGEDGSWLGELVESEYHDKTFDNQHYSELIDMDSLINNFLICEITMDWDGMKNSTYLYKDIEGIAYMGPAWDFDWAYGNINMYNIDTFQPTGWHTTNDYFAREYYFQSVQWNRYLIKDPYFIWLVYNKYKEIRPAQLQDFLDSLDAYENHLAFDGTRNDERWEYTYTPENYCGATPEHYHEAFASLKKFIKTRINWLDKQFENYFILLNSINAFQSSHLFTVDTDREFYYVKGYRSQWQINGTDMLYFEADEPISIPQEYLTSETNVAVVRILDTNSNYIYESDEPESQPASHCILIHSPQGE